MVRPTVESHPPERRSLPSRDINEHTIEDAYVQFILYANPGVVADTTELRRAFRSPPRSDGKSFNTYTIWQLIRKLDYKEIKTWAQLAIELGVEPPSAEQSGQKLQQYAVRLKKWLHALHIDAFFEYCLNKPHTYYTQLPTASREEPEEGRDGVPIEEDLALRALLPEWRPKRGRRKADKDSDPNSQMSTSKRPRLDTSASVDSEHVESRSAVFPQSAIPWSAFPDDLEQHEPWSLASAISAGHVTITQRLTSQHSSDHMDTAFRRRAGRSPSAYPRSAVTPGHDSAQKRREREPHSAITPSATKARSRRRHGPAVSSAWLNSSSSNTGKHRGRPPNNRFVQDGPYSTFPVNPQLEDSTSHLFTGNLNPHEKPSYSRSASSPDMVAKAPLQTARLTQPMHGVRPGRLQLQVPQHSSGPIRLATPPTLMVNGDSDNPLSPISGYHGRRDSAEFFRNPEDLEESSIPSKSGYQRLDAVLQFTVEDVCRAFASRLVRSKIIGRPMALSIEEAKLIAIKTVESICRANQERLSNALLPVRCAYLLGVEKEMGCGIGANQFITIRAVLQPATSSKSRKQNAADMRESYDYTVSIDASESNNFSSNIQIRNIIVPVQSAPEAVHDQFDALRESLKTFYENSMSDDRQEDPAGLDAPWKDRFVDMEQNMRVKEEQLQKLRRMMLEVVMAGD